MPRWALLELALAGHVVRLSDVTVASTELVPRDRRVVARVDRPLPDRCPACITFATPAAPAAPEARPRPLATRAPVAHGSLFDRAAPTA